MSLDAYYFIISPSGKKHQVTIETYRKIRDSVFEDAGRGRPVWLKDEDPEPFIVGDWRGLVMFLNAEAYKPAWRRKE